MAFTASLISSGNAFESLRTPKAHAERVNPFDQMRKRGRPLLPPVHSSVNLGRRRAQKASRKDASVEGGGLESE